MTATLIAALLVAKLYPDMPTGRWLHWLLVDEPIRLVSRLTARDVVLAVFLALAFQAFAFTFTMELAMLAAIDTTVYFEAATAVWSAAALAKARIAWASVRSTHAAMMRRGRRAAIAIVRSVRRVRHRATVAIRKGLAAPDEDRRSVAAFA